MLYTDVLCLYSGGKGKATQEKGMVYLNSKVQEEAFERGKKSGWVYTRLS